ncbi:MAG: methyl-accepting chemotaxis protein [Thermodesulfobacteriota bacterium]|nr:methyl-accepting chemotaxis protein [Thermodesulfobacteriota bacterium]
MKKRSLNFKLISGGIIIVLLPLLVVGFFSINKASTALDKLAREQAVNLARDLANMTQLVLQEEMKLANDLSTTETVLAAVAAARQGADDQAPAFKSLSRMLARIMNKRGMDYEAVIITNPGGIVIATDTSNNALIGTSLADRDYFQAARQGRTNVSSPVKSKISGKPIAPVCAPIVSGSGEFLGTVVNVMKLDFIANNITTITVGETGYPFMTDKNGLCIAHPNMDHVMSTNFTRLEGMGSIMDKMLSQQTGVEGYTFEGIEKIAGFAPVPLTRWSIGVTQPSHEFMSAAITIRNVILLVGGLFLAATIIGVLFFSKGISNPIMRAVSMLNAGAEQVSAAAAQVSSASQSLAEGASESAASIEETSSSLEEISAMTKQNASHAKEANSLMIDARKGVDQANDSMTALTASMEKISTASQETSKIIKTIDEIAFQTNLLALNAAVEAARAGEAGAGFAVVADEVRNLAMRAAEAAKNTSGIIEGTVKRVEEGSELVTKTNDEFKAVAENAAKVGALVDEITAASEEQAKGVDQVNQAVGQMDKVTQQNAANAEEAASSSEELNAQAEEMKSIVGDLVAVVGGNNTAGGPASVSEDSIRHRSVTYQAHAPVMTQSVAGSVPLHQTPAAATAIPMEEEQDDFKDF